MTEPRRPFTEDLDPDLAAYFRALAEEDVPEPEPRRVREARRRYRALVRELRPRRPWWQRMWGASLAVRWAAVALTLLFLLWGSGVAVVRAAERAVPGSPLYAVKRWHEALLLRKARTPQEKARLHRTFAYRRVQELNSLLAQGRQEEARALLQDLLLHVDALARMVPQTPETVPRSLTAQVEGVAVRVDPAYRESLLRALNTLYRGRRLVGELKQRQGATWVVDGATVEIGPETLIQGLPQVGDVVEVVGQPLDARRWQARWIRPVARGAPQVGVSPSAMTLVGKLERTGEGWQIEGVAFAVPDTALASMLQEGRLVEAELQWDPNARQWVAVRIEPKAAYRGGHRELKGRLDALEPDRIQIDGTWWPLAPDAEREDALVPGMMVEVELWQDAQGRWVVVEVEPMNDEEERDAGSDEVDQNEPEAQGEDEGQEQRKAGEVRDFEQQEEHHDEGADHEEHGEDEDDEDSEEE